jgi:transcription-repair coupling factor (superfamily II helicase)
VFFEKYLKPFGNKMKVQDLLTLYQEDPFVQVVSNQIKQSETEKKVLQLKGFCGSLDAVLASSLYAHSQKSYVMVLSDREEAAYFFNDVKDLLVKASVHFYPMSYKKPYQHDDIDNANVLQRSEVLNILNNAKAEPHLIVTYAEALSEKVINRRSLLKNTFSVQINEKLDPEFLSEVLISYEFERNDFVYEPGQFSVRGGIIDVFGFSNDLPYRIELWGDEVESIRTFDPESQLSQESVSRINIIPNIQTRLTTEQRVPFVEFLAENTVFWVKDLELCLEQIELSFEKAETAYNQLIPQGADIKISTDPKQLYETRRSFLNQIKTFDIVEFGRRAYLKTENKVTFQSKSQPTFNKDFNKLVNTLSELQDKGFTCIIASESQRQLERLSTIFEEIDPHLTFLPLPIALKEGFIDEGTKIALFTDHQIFDRFHRIKNQDRFSKTKAITLKELKSLQVGDYVAHVDHGIGRFAGLERTLMAGREQEAIRMIYKDDDILLISIHSLHKISKYTGKDGAAPTMTKLGSPDWENKKSRVKKQVKDIAKELIQLYAKRRKAPGFAFSPDSYMQAELESSFIYEDTPDQAKATADIKVDMEKPHPMDRLVCGDVGFGKTEVAIRAAFKAVADSKQVAVLVPTTVLAMQHYHTFKDRLEKLPAKVEYINRFKSAKQIKETLERVEKGVTDILIGTQKIVNKDVKFKNLGLLIIDEEQKFGVKTKDRLKEMRFNVDVLTLTATPIPRTLHFSLMGARDLSVIATPPPNRQPVTTEVHVFNDILVRDAIRSEIERGGQAFFVHNRVSDIDSVANNILRLVPDAKVCIAHGQMDGDKLENVMIRFIEGHYDVMVSTNLIESGLDISNANTMIINNAQNFGLSDLHQLRGRVGRSNKKAYCYLLTPALSLLSTDSRKRLGALEEFSDLGDGFRVAMRDLDIRGAGNLLGAEQSGFINDLGFEMYHKILDEAIEELKESDFKDLFHKEITETAKNWVPDCQIETDLDVLVPDHYVSNISERLSIYNQLDNLKTEAELIEFKKNLVDRFGKMPRETEDLFVIVRIRWVAEKLGIEKLQYKNNILKCYFVSSEQQNYFTSETFGKVLDYVKKHIKTCQLRDNKGKAMLNIENLTTINQILTELNSIFD